MLLLQANPFQWFISGGPIGMFGTTLFLIALFFAAWKAPNWVKEIGLAALTFALIYTLIEFSMAFRFIQECDEEVSQCVIAGGISVGLIPAIYGLIVYFISLVIRIIQKPRI